MNSNVVVKSEKCFEWSFERLGKIKSLKSPEFLFAERTWYFEWSELSQEQLDLTYPYRPTISFGEATDHVHEDDLLKFKPRLSMIISNPRGNRGVNIPYNVITVVSATSNRNRRIRHPPHFRTERAYKKMIRDFCFRPGHLEHPLTFSENQNNITAIKIGFHFSEEVIVYSDVSPKSGGIPKINDACNSSLLKDMTELLSDSSLSDVELKCRDGNVKAHKVILCARSKVFAAMLQSNMLEGQHGEVKIHEMDMEDLKKFLQYIYTGTLPDLTFDAAVRLYEAGDKYAVLGLKNRCAEILAENFSEENACDLLVVADAHSDKDLKQEIISYILHKKIPLRKDMWTEFLKRHPVLAGEVLTKYYYLQNHASM